MDANTYYEPSAAEAYFREFGEEMPETEYCAGAHCTEVCDVSTLSDSGLCGECESARLEDLAGDEEVVEAVLVSGCCGAGMGHAHYDFGTCPETGYRDSEERVTCLQCGGEAEPILAIQRPAAPMPEELVEDRHRRPVRMQGELFQQEVA